MMVVTAVRDDGSLLVTTDQGDFLVTTRGTVPVLAQSALARGTWDDPGEPAPQIPAATRAAIAAWRGRDPFGEAGQASAP